MKKIISLIIVLTMCCSLLSGFEMIYAQDTIQWFGNAENNYTEGFEGETNQFTFSSGNCYIQIPAWGTDKIISGYKTLVMENNGSVGVASADMANKKLTSGKVKISFAEKIRKSTADTSISITSSDANLTSTSDLTSEYIFQVRNNGANFDLYANNKKIGALSTNSAFIDTTSKMSYK